MTLSLRRLHGAPSRAGSLFFESSSRSSLLLEHDLFRKPVPTFRDYAPGGFRPPDQFAPRSGTYFALRLAILTVWLSIETLKRDKKLNPKSPSTPWPKGPL